MCQNTPSLKFSLRIAQIVLKKQLCGIVYVKVQVLNIFKLINNLFKNVQTCIRVTRVKVFRRITARLGE